MNYKKIIGIALAFSLIGIVVGLYGFNIIEGNNYTPALGVENITRTQVKGIYDIRDYPKAIYVGIGYPVIPEKMVIYKVYRNISDQELIQIANNLGISGELSKIGPDFISIGKGVDHISSYEGTVVYLNRTDLPGFTPDYIDTHLPSDEEARKIADEFLDQHNIRPEGAVFYSTSHNVGHFVSGDDHVEIKNSESINVWYKHWIGDYMILTDKLRVEVGVNGDIRKMFREWPDYESYQELSIIAPGEAFGYLKDTGVFIPDGMKNPEKATITNISLVYIDQTMTEDLDYLIPVYYFEGEVQGDGRSATFYQCIPATPEFAATITGDDKK